MTAAKVVAIGVGLYAIYLPVAWLMHRNYALPPRPSGNPVEMLLAFHRDEPDHFVARSHIFRTAIFPDTSRISVYENLTPLPTGHVGFTPDLGVYIIRLKTSDGSDPRSNGRRYWVVGTQGG
jgi:hypothetical protein